MGMVFPCGIDEVSSDVPIEKCTDGARSNLAEVNTVTSLDLTTPLDTLLQPMSTSWVMAAWIGSATRSQRPLPPPMALSKARSQSRHIQINGAHRCHMAVASERIGAFISPIPGSE